MEEFYAGTDDLNLVTWIPLFTKILKKDQADPSFHAFDRCVCGVLEQYVKMEHVGAPSLHLSVFLDRELRKMYHASLFHHIAEIYPEATARILALAKACYEIDVGLYVVVGEEIKPVTRDLSEQEKQKRLVVHDKARPLFKAAMLRGFSTMSRMPDRNYLIYWGSLVYNHMHAFQAPLTTDMAQATRDAMGLSDHFGTMLQEVIDESPPIN